MGLRLIFYFVILCLSGSFAFLFSDNLLRAFIFFALLFSLLISIFEAIYRREILILFKNIKNIKENLYIILERFFKITIPIFLFLNIFVTILIEMKPRYLASERPLFHYEICIFMVILLIFSIYSIKNLNFRLAQLKTYEKQIWISNNMIDDNQHKHFEKIDKILDYSFELLSPKSSLTSKKSIWILIPDYDPKTQAKYFKKIHYKCSDPDIRIYAKLMIGNVPFMNVDEWIKACDELYKIIIRNEKRDSLENEYQKFRNKRNEISSVAGYIYLRNFQLPLISRIGEGNCLVYNDKYIDLFENTLERKKVDWKSMVVWNIIYQKKKIGVLFFFDTERYGFRPAHRLIMKNMANILSPTIYNAIKNKYYGETSADMLENALDIDSEDEIVKKLGYRYRSKEWKNEINEIQNIFNSIKKLGGGY